MASFSFNTAAELFPAAIRKKSGRASRIGDLAPRPKRFASRSRSCRRNSLNGAYLQVDEARFDQSGIRTLYESQDFSVAAPSPCAAACAERQGGHRSRVTSRV